MLTAGAPSLWFALGASMVGAVLALLDWRQPRPALRRASEVALMGAFLGTLVALLSLAAAFVTRDLAFRTVATYTSLLTSRRHAFSGLWAGHAGQLLWLTTGVLGASVFAMLAHRRRQAQSVATGVCAAIAAVLLLQLCTTVSPFVRLTNLPPEGRGMHPLLMHAAMPLQPALVLLGLGVTVVPFAWVVAALVAGEPHAAWRDVARRWLIASWAILTVAMAIGLAWAQHQLGWFGYFLTWEPYAGAPLLPWLALTALVLAMHSGADRLATPLWTGGFIAFSFLLAAFAFHRLRTGIEDSIRAVAAAPATFLLVVGAIGLLFAATVGVLGLRSAAAPRNTRARLGAGLTVVGALMSVLGFSGSIWRTEKSATVDTGEVVTATDPFGATWRFTSMGLSSYEEMDHTVLAVVVNATRTAKRVALLTSRQRQYFDARNSATFEPSTTVGSALTWRDAVSIAFLGRVDRTTAAVRITFVPLVPLLYAGLALLIVGLPLAAWPARQRDEVACMACGAAQPLRDARFCEACGAPLT
jgi:cytochrome c biogenesis factor